jgi:hypothetical protein
MADPFKLSRKVDATVTSNLHTMDYFKLPLTKERNMTLGLNFGVGTEMTIYFIHA